MNLKLESPVDNTHRVGPKQKEGALEFRIKKNTQTKKTTIFPLKSSTNASMFFRN